MIHWIRFAAPVSGRMRWEASDARAATVLPGDRFIRLTDGTARDRLVPMSNVAEICQDRDRADGPKTRRAKRQTSDAMPG